jgi:hypothetical protein
MREGEAVFDELRAEWESRASRRRIADLQGALQLLLGDDHSAVSGWAGPNDRASDDGRQ